MIKKVTIASILAVFVYVIPNVVLTSEDSNTNGLQLQESKELSFEGESFELQTWLDPDGNVFHTVPTEVKNAEAIADYIQDLLYKENSTSLNQQINKTTDQRK